MKPKPLVPGRKSGDARRTSAKGEAAGYLLKVELEGSNPSIWRRIRVPGEISLSILHGVLQTVMGWENCHLHEFKIGRASYGSVAERDDPFAEGMTADKGIRLRDAIGTRIRSFQYIYDFGDNWTHEITVEDIVIPENAAPSIKCLGGERACPPEDCGGLYGYYGYLEILGAPSHPEYEDVKEWMGRHDPGRFEIDRVNVRLKKFVG